MTTANVGVVAAHSSTALPLYTTTTDQFGKTVYTSNRSVTLILDTLDVNNPSLVTANTTTGVFTLTGNITYQLTASARLINFIPDQAALQWVDKTIGGTVGQPAKFDTIASTNVTYYTPGRDTTVVLTAAAGSPTSGMTFSYPATVTNASAGIQVVTGWTE